MALVVNLHVETRQGAFSQWSVQLIEIDPVKTSLKFWESIETENCSSIVNTGSP